MTAAFLAVALWATTFFYICVSSFALGLHTNASTNDRPSPSSSPYSPRPKCIVFDLDKTLWNRPRFRKGPPFTPINDGLKGIRAASGEVLDLYPDVREMLLSIQKNNDNKGKQKQEGETTTLSNYSQDEDTSDEEESSNATKIAFVSRTHRKEWSKLFLNELSVVSSSSNNKNNNRAEPIARIEEVSGDNDDGGIIIPTTTTKVMTFCDALVIRDGSKAKVHLKEVARVLNLDMKDLLFFDDREHEIRDAARLSFGRNCGGGGGGVIGVHCPNGLNWERFHFGLEMFARIRGSSSRSID